MRVFSDIPTMAADFDPLGFIDEDGDAYQITLPGKIPAPPDSPISGLRWWARQDIEWRISAIAENRAWLIPHFSWAYGHCRDAERQWMAGLPSQRNAGAYHYAIVNQRVPVGSLSIYVDPATPRDEGLVIPSAEITYWVTRENAGHGYGTAALVTATEASHNAGIEYCYLMIDRDNESSIRTATKAGYVIDHPGSESRDQVLMCHER